MAKFQNEIFIGREKELAFLNKAYGSNKAELVVLYGRRRVGKTELLKEFCKDKPSIFYLCRKYTDEIQLAEFTKTLLTYNNEEYFSAFQNWDKAFSYLEKLESDKKLVLVIDEFPYACKSNDSIPSVLQIAWDELLHKCNIMIVLCGSSISFIEDELLAEKNPLYGRATGTYKVLPMPYYDAAKFLPNFADEDKLTALAILGGIPHYLKQFDSSYSLQENIISNILTKGTVLFSEVDFLLYQELRETSVYNTIIQSIALGSSAFNEIQNRTQLEKSKLSVYLKKLMELNIVEKQLPALADENDKNNSTKGLYNLTDNFFKFWFTFAYPNLGLLEMDDPEIVWEDFIAPNLHHFAAKPFEKICIEYMYAMNKKRKLAFRFTSIDRWWGKVTKPDENDKLRTESVEIDILGTDAKQKNYIIGECKFRNEAFDLSELKKLQDKATSFKGTHHYYLFSLSGFTSAVAQEAELHPNIHLVTPSDILTQS